jgi:hypothetical protein
MNGRNWSYTLSLVGLVCLGVAFARWLHVNAPDFGLLWSIVSGLTGPLLLLFACINKTRNWSGITALCMIPFAAIGVMDIVATLGRPDSGMALGIISIATFFLVLDAGRRVRS